MTHDLDPLHLSDADFLAAFHDGTLPAAAFDHAGHLRAAFLVLCAEPRNQAIESICAGISRIARKLGAAGKFHRTLTVAMAQIIAARRAQTPGQDWPGFLELNEDLLHDAKRVLAKHYSDALLQSDLARAEFVAPDREPLPE